MRRKEENILNEEVKKLLKLKGITDNQMVILGYKLGHKYIDNGINDALPTIIDVISEKPGMTFREASNIMQEKRPIVYVKKDTTQGDFKDVTNKIIEKNIEEIVEKKSVVVEETRKIKKASKVNKITRVKSQDKEESSLTYTPFKEFLEKRERK